MYTRWVGKLINHHLELCNLCINEISIREQGDGYRITLVAENWDGMKLPLVDNKFMRLKDIVYFCDELCTEFRIGRGGTNPGGRIGQDVALPTIMQYTAYTNNQGKEVECGLKRVEGTLEDRVKAIKQALQGLDIRGMDNLDRINTLVLDIDTPRGRQELNLGFRGGLATEVTDKVFEFIDLQLGAM